MRWCVIKCSAGRKLFEGVSRQQYRYIAAHIIPATACSQRVAKEMDRVLRSSEPMPTILSESMLPSCPPLDATQAAAPTTTVVALAQSLSSSSDDDSFVLRAAAACAPSLETTAASHTGPACVASTSVETAAACASAVLPSSPLLAVHAAGAPMLTTNSLAPPRVAPVTSFGSCCSSIFPYRFAGPVGVSQPPGEAATAAAVEQSTAEAEAATSSARVPAVDANDEAQAKTDKAYDLTIGAASLIGGFAIRDVIASPGVHEFGSNTWAFYAYRPLVAFATTLDLYCVLVLVLNRYLAARAFKDVSENAHARFLAATATTRMAALWAFLYSLPIFLIAAAVKQVHDATLLQAAGGILVLVVGCLVLLRTFAYQGQQLEEIAHEQAHADATATVAAARSIPTPTPQITHPVVPASALATAPRRAATTGAGQGAINSTREGGRVPPSPGAATAEDIAMQVGQPLPKAPVARVERATTHATTMTQRHHAPEQGTSMEMV